MNRTKLIYNPVSGKAQFESQLDDMLEAMKVEGFCLEPHRLSSQNDMEDAVKDVSRGGYSSIIVAGGDGTVNSLVNSMVDFDVHLPVYIVPAGTSNVFARGLGYSTEPTVIANTLRENQLRSIDIGKANKISFVNVLAAGFPSNVAHEVSPRLKHTLGLLAYCLKGFQQLAKMKGFRVRITLSDRVINENLLLMLVLNSSTAGRFLEFAPKAKLDDGRLDILLVRACEAQDLLPLLLKVAQGNHINDDSFIYIQSSEFHIDCPDDIATDVDGELGPKFPLHISVLRRRINVFEPAIPAKL